jgi:DNA-binding response OmpR family regulator
MPKILVVEDNVELAQSIELCLRGAHYSVELSFDGKDGLHRLLSYQYDCVICDWSLPGASGIEVIKQYRQSGGTALILMLTGNTGIEHTETGLNAGADDYLTKPFSTRELLARVNALTRRAGASLHSVFTAGSITYDESTATVTKSGEIVQLTRKEILLLGLFLKSPQRLFPLDLIRQEVWSDGEVSAESIRTHIKTLRKKLPQENGEDLIVSVHGEGYRLNPVFW